MTDNMEPKVYELTTIQDIFEKVPADRIQLCCAELGTLLATAKNTGAFLDCVNDDLGIKATLKFLNPLKWIDDGKGELVVNYSMNETPMFTTVIKRKPRVNGKAV